MNVLHIFPKNMVTRRKKKLKNVFKKIKEMVIKHDEIKCSKLVRNIILFFLLY